MDDATRQTLIKKFGEAKNFDSNYSEPNRFWFVEKVIRKLESEGENDAAVEQKTGEVVQKAAAVVKANRDFANGLAAAGNSRFTASALKSMQRHRVEILYGAIAFNREFAETTNLNYLLFIAKRRFRSICRMFFWVNPNRQGYFRYPHRCSGDQRWRVNEDAKAFWEEVTPPFFNNYSPSKLKSAGVADPVTAVETLFKKKTDPCKGNLFDCEVTTSIVFLDSLRAAKNEDTFMKKLATTAATYLLIHGFSTDPIDPLATVTFMNDTTAAGLMSNVGLPAGDLQVGDQCYIINHPLYKTFRPTGSWTGEYSLVYVSGDRNYRSKNGFVFGGHGKEGTLFKFYDEFLSELKSHLAIARQLMVAHLAFMRGGAPAIDPGTVTEAEHDISIQGAAPVSFRLLEYDKTVMAKDFTKIPTKSKKKPVKGAPAFVIVQSKTEHVFFLSQVDQPDQDKPLVDNLKKKITDIVPPGTIAHPIQFKRITDPPVGATPDVVFGLAHWGVAYVESGAVKIWPFFEEVGGKLQRKELVHDDLFNSPFSLFTPASTNLDVRRPRIEFAAAHQSFLTSNGAF